MSSASAVLHAVEKFPGVLGQIHFLEGKRWRYARMSAIDEKLISEAAAKFGVSEEHIKIVLRLVCTTKRTITRREITETKRRKKNQRGVKKMEVTDIMMGLHCPKHGPGANVVNVVVYPDGDKEVFCWCGNLLAIEREGKMYTTDGSE